MTSITFEELAREPDDRIDLARGAALIAKDVYDELDVEALLARLDELAGPLRGGALAGLPLRKQAEALRERFRELGFRGNTEDYYDARNSLLPDVLDRRTGIPISLSFVWCEIARRAGAFARGVAFPGHFLARLDDLPSLSGRATAEAAVIVDPFNDAKVLTTADVLGILRRAQGPNADLSPSLVEAATARTTLVRMLTNLKAIWTARGDTRHAFVALTRMLSLLPDSADVLRERGGLAAKLGLTDLARRDFERAIELDPRVADAALRKQLDALARGPKGAPN